MAWLAEKPPFGTPPKKSKKGLSGPPFLCILGPGRGGRRGGHFSSFLLKMAWLAENPVFDPFLDPPFFRSKLYSRKKMAPSDSAHPPFRNEWAPVAENPKISKNGLPRNGAEKALFDPFFGLFLTPKSAIFEGPFCLQNYPSNFFLMVPRGR